MPTVSASVAPAVSAAPTSLVPNGTAKAKCRCRLSGTPIDYGFAEARTLYGIIGVKCWVNKRDEVVSQQNSRPSGPRGPRRPRA